MVRPDRIKAQILCSKRGKGGGLGPDLAQTFLQKESRQGLGRHAIVVYWPDLSRGERGSR